MFWTDIEQAERVFDPFLELERMSKSLSRLMAPKGTEFPAVNVWEGTDAASVTAELPGIDPKDVEISVKGRSLTLRGSRKADDLAEGEYYQRKERWSGDFERVISLPFDVEAEKVSARYSRGVLTVVAPRAESERPRKIAIITE